MPRHSPSLGVHVPPSPQETAVPVCGEQGWGALLSPPNPDSVHHVAWSKIVVLFFINLCVPQSLFWEKKKKGMDPVVESNLGALHAAWCYTFLGIYISGCQRFHSRPAATPGRCKQSSSLCRQAEPFYFQKLLQNRQVGSAGSPGSHGPLDWCPASSSAGYGTTDPGKQPGRGHSVIKLCN